jgi:hypothetical protein
VTYPGQRSRLSDRRWRLLVVCVVILILACSQDETAKGQPSTFQVVKAVAKSLLSNSVEAREATSPEALAGRPDALARRPDALARRPDALARTPDALATSLDAMTATPVGTAAVVPSAAPVALEALPAETCLVPYRGTVTIIPVRTPAALQRSIDDRPRVPVVYETEDTAIWRDGRVLTLDLENVGSHLNAVGWASNQMEILGTGSRPGGSSANLGWDSGQSGFKKRGTAKKRKRRRG